VKNKKKINIEEKYINRIRDLKGIWKTLIVIVSVSLISFHLYTSIFGLFPNIIQRSIHLMLGLILCFAYFPLKKQQKIQNYIPFYDLIFILIIIISCIYIILVYDEIMFDPMRSLSKIDLFLGLALFILVLEAGRRSAGIIFSIMAAFLLIYAYYGNYFPGIWQHKGFSFFLILETLYHTGNGIWGILLDISATILAVFAIFGGVLLATGGGSTFIEIAKLMTKKSIGGTAKVAIIASSLLGMASGSAIANVVTTGTFTIPAMKASGYKNYFAGAVEAVASTGGQLVPPIMGAGAFIMAEITGVPYLHIAKAAIIPALLYYIGLYWSVHLEAIKQNITSTSGNNKSNNTNHINFVKIIIFIIPIIVLLFFLISGYTAMKSGVWAVIVAFFLYLFCNLKIIFHNIRSLLKVIYEVCMTSANTIMRTVALLASAQIIVSLISLTGIGVKFSDMIITLGKGNEFLGLLLSAIICLILGMGLPTTGAYVLAASVVAPAVVRLGIPPVVAHLFIFYFSVLSTITPPVCAASLLASSIAKSPWVKTAITGVQLALPGFLVPFAFVYRPVLLLTGGSISATILFAIMPIIGIISLGSGIIGYLFGPIQNTILRIILLMSGTLMFVPKISINITGLVIIIIIFSLKYLQYNIRIKKLNEEIK